jgi:hypothetical protein
MVADRRRGKKVLRKITAFNRACATACRKARCPGRMFERYNIVSGNSVAAKRLDELRGHALGR